MQTPTLLHASEAHAAEAPTILSVQDLSVSYNGDTAIQQVSFEVQTGEKIAIIGPNGAGKSTLIKAIMGLLQPQSGSIALPGNDPQRLGYIPQHEEVNWDFPVTVRDVVMMGHARAIGWLRWPNRKQWAAVDTALERVGLGHLAGRQIGQLSGGQRRRVFIARTLAQKADVLLMDEPFSGVDPSAQADLVAVLDELQRAGLTIVLSTHDLNLAFTHFDRVMVLRQRVIAYGPPDEVYTPDVLTQVYGGKLATWDDGRQVLVFVDEHGCDSC